MKPETVDEDLAAEAGERLDQLDFLMQQIVELQDEWWAITKQIVALAEQNGGTYHDRNHFTPILNGGAFRIRLYGEAFYYFASRLITILRRYPAFKKLDAPGIRNARNHLIEHPEKASSGITQQIWSHGAGVGPRFKISRRTGQKPIPPDEGLFVNAEKLRDNIERKLAPVLLSIPDE